MMQLPIDIAAALRFVLEAGSSQGLLADLLEEAADEIEDLRCANSNLEEQAATLTAQVAELRTRIQNLIQVRRSQAARR